MSAQRPTLAVFDAVTGQPLYRRPLGQDEHSRGTAVEYFPGADHGGTPKHVDFTAKRWLAAGATKPSGQQLAHLLRRQRRQEGAARARRCRPEERHLELPAHAVPPHGRARFCDNP